MIWRDLTWSYKSPKLNLHHLRNIPTGFKMGMLTPKLGIDNYSCLKIFEKKSLFNKAHNFRKHSAWLLKELH